MSDKQQNFGFDENTAPTPEQQERDLVREEYRARLAEKLRDPEFRKIEGFPIGTDEAILALSDPPYYTACPNPFIEEWLAENAKPYNADTDDYHREPFAADVSEGKNDPIYNAHSYHTKVPHKAIMRYILHYTEPGDVVYDGFCGTGMTGVAAQMCGDKAQVESLGYKVCADGTILDAEGKPFSKLGARKAILNDLSPAATFIAYNYNTLVDAAAFEREAKRILKEVEDECGWMYATLHDASEEETERIANAVSKCKTADELRELVSDLHSPKCELRDEYSKMQVGRINYTVWSDVFVCPNCGTELVFWDVAIDEKAGKVRDEFTCSHCRAETTKRQCTRATVTRYDTAIQQTITQARQVPALINYKVNKKSFDKHADAYDVSIESAVGRINLPYWFPADRMPEGRESRRNDRTGVTHAHHFFTTRNLYTLAAFFAKAQNPVKQAVFTVIFSSVSKLCFYRFKGGGNKPRSGTLYMSSIPVEANVLVSVTNKVGDMSKMVRFPKHRSYISTQSSTSPMFASGLCDYIFVDPPFGGNLMYSELNFLWESWLGVQDNNKCEAITNPVQKKALPEYQALMTACFRGFNKMLKPGRWMTIEFHNSANSVWNSIHEGLERAGFVVAHVSSLDKQHSSILQFSSYNAVDKDLVITCYKPRHEFEERFKQLGGKTEGVVEFVREHLSMLPVAPVNISGKLETVAERTRFLLFDRMVAYHLQRGARIPLSAADFYKLLEDEFIERDEMYFLPDQSIRYDALKARGVETEQLSIFVRDEKTAVQWIRGQLTETAQTLGELTPTFMQELREWDSHEPRPELRDLLREYFVEENGVWRVPDPNNERDLELLRKNAMLKVFREYANAKAPLKVFRKEAILEGFRHCWETKQYRIIVTVCEKIPEKILHEIHDFVQFYDIAKDLAPTEEMQTAFVWE